MTPRIVFVIQSTFALGPLNQLRPLLERLSNEKFEVHVVCLSKSESDRLEATDDSVELHKLDLTSRPFNQLTGLRKLLFELNPRHLHGWGDATHSLVSISSFGLNAKRYFTHFENPNDFGAAKATLARAFGSPNDVHVYSHESIGPTPPTHLARTIQNSTTTIKCDRAAMRQRLLKLIGRNSNKTLLVGTASNFAPRYRLKDLVWAIDLLCCVRDDVHLLIFGEGDPKPLQRFTSKTLAGQHIHLIEAEQVKHDDISGLDVYWNAQRLNPNPTVILNCMSLAIPVVSVLDQSTQDFLLPMQTAFATNFGARDEFARWTKYILEQEEMTRQLAQQGRAHVEKLFTTEKMVESYITLYSEA